MYYDRVLSKSEERLNINDNSSQTDFSEDVQDFLNQMGERFENNINTSDDDIDKN